MKITHLGAIFILAISFWACTNTAEETTSETQKEDLKTSLQGTWQTAQINVAVNTVDGLDSFRAEYLDQKIWEEHFKMQSPIYYFQADQKFRRVHLDLNDQIVDESKGMWNVFGDTLMLIEKDATYNYIVKGGEGKAAFRTFLDWDGDGEEDDEFQSLQRKISISTE